MAVSPLGCPSIMDQSFIINVTPTSDNRHTHTHTQRERERERDCSWMKPQLKPNRLSQKKDINSSTPRPVEHFKVWHQTYSNAVPCCFSSIWPVSHSSFNRWCEATEQQRLPGSLYLAAGESPSSYLHPRNCCSNVHFFGCFMTPPQRRRLIFRCKVTKRRRGYGSVCFT